MTYILYYSLAVIPVFLDSKSQKYNYNKILLFISYLFLWFFAAFRYDVGSDYFSYIRMYNKIGSRGISWALSSVRTEPLYAIFNWIIYNVFENHNLVFVLSSTILLSLIFSVIIKNKNKLSVGLSLFLFVTTFYLSMFTFIRLSISAGIIFYSYEYLVNRNPVKYFFLIILAIGFHFTAIVMLPVYFIVDKRLKFFVLKFLFVLIFVAAALMLFTFFVDIIGGFLGYEYAHRVGNIRGGINQLILFSPIFIFIFIFRKRLILYNSKNIIYTQIFWLGSILMLFTLWLGILDRMAVYFQFSIILLIPQIFKVMNNKEKIIFPYLIVLYFLLRFSYSIFGNMSLIPYENIIF
ncbi:hypothetical protein Halsa_0055 [Halanaerobium hydrogeniformans]|uniref:EpsG family protein n=2 Tax=Halanaerobium hydrogeniformans TaxID=656519 RepID=E4RNL6_HALHG|nr:hypothetical protein Halsa_0055 [Halanaerobium hydrogeniformans]